MLKIDPNLVSIESSSIEIPNKGILRTAPPFTSMVAGDSGIYIGGTISFLDPSYNSIYLAKFNSDCKCTWYRYIDIPEGSSEFIQGVTVCKEGNVDFLYLTGLKDSGHPFQPFILKFDTSGNLINQINGDEDYIGEVIGGYNGQIYIVYGRENDPNHLILAVYDKKLNKIWEQIFDLGLLELPMDIAITDDYLFICGFLFDVDWGNMEILSIDGFILKCDTKTGNKEWLKTIKNEYSVPYSIHADNSYLYLSGYCSGLNLNKLETFILKCNHDGEGGKGKTSHSVLDMFKTFLENHPRMFSKLRNLFIFD